MRLCSPQYLHTVCMAAETLPSQLGDSEERIENLYVIMSFNTLSSTVISLTNYILLFAVNVSGTNSFSGCDRQQS